MYLASERTCIVILMKVTEDGKKELWSFLKAKRCAHFVFSSREYAGHSKSWFSLKYIKAKEMKENSGMSLDMRFTTAILKKEHFDGAVRGT